MKTGMIVNENMEQVVEAFPEQCASALANLMPVDMVEPIDISNTIT
ncbi:MAG TPA: hypothetical protein VIQ30_16015 [Pseudonocardia sp.]